MATATGLGGVLVRAADPVALTAWYEQHLGLTSSNGAFSFPASAQRAEAVLAFFRQDDDYFPVGQAVMIDLQVDDLDGVLDRLIEQGVTVEPHRADYDFGRFGWFTDPEGNRVELWQPTTSP